MTVSLRNSERAPTANRGTVRRVLFGLIIGLLLFAAALSIGIIGLGVGIAGSLFRPIPKNQIAQLARDEGETVAPPESTRRKRPKRDGKSNPREEDAEPPRSDSAASWKGSSETEPERPQLPPAGTFSGVAAAGTRTVFTIDCSAKMQGYPIKVVAEELQKALPTFSEAHEIIVIAYAEDPFIMYSPRPVETPVPCTRENQQKIVEWLTVQSYAGEPAPEIAIETALEFSPTTVYLVTACPLSNASLAKITKLNSRRISIHAIGFNLSPVNDALRKLAKQNHGAFGIITPTVP